MTELAGWLAGPEGAGAIAAAEALAAQGADPLAAASALRGRGLSADQAGAALTQAGLRRIAIERYGLADPGLLTRDGLEQGSRPEVAAVRAGLIAAARPQRVIDATAGLGFDTRALVAALDPGSAPVIAIERDPGIAALLRANVPGADIVEGDAREVIEALAPGPDDLVFVDPARRSGRRSVDGSRAQPERDPERWSPPWSWVVGLAARTRVCAKVAPGFPPHAVPEGWCAQWASWHRTGVEAFLCSWPALPRARRALAVDSGAHLDGVGAPLSPVGPVGHWLHEVDPAVSSAGLVDDLIAQSIGLHRIGDHPYWLGGDAPAATPLLRSFHVIEELPVSMKELRRALAAHGIGALTVKTRGGRRDAQRFERELRMAGSGTSATIIATDAGGRDAVYLVDRP